MKKVNKVVLAGVFASSIISQSALAETNYYEAALQAFNKHDIDAAFIHLKNALRKNESNLPAKLLLAKVLIEKKSFAAAEQELNDSLAQGADINLIINELGQVLISQGKYTQALHLADGKVLHQQGNLAFQLIKAKALRSLNNDISAEKVYNNILSIDKTNTDATIGLTSIYLANKRITEAKALLKQVVSQQPNNSKVWQLKGQLARLEGNPTQAIEFFNKAISLSDDDVFTLQGLANSYLAVKKYALADETIDKALAIAPKDPQVQLLKASILRSLDQDKQADDVLIKLSNQLSAIDQAFMLSQPELLLIDAMSSYQQRDWKQAKSKFEIYLNQLTDKDDVNTLMLLADTEIKLDKPELALKLLADKESKIIKNKDFALILAGLYLQFGQNFKAEYILNKLVKVHPKDSGVLILMAKVLAESDKAQQALQMLEKANIKDNANYTHTMAVIAIQTGDLGKGAKYTQALIAKYPNNETYQLLNFQILIQQQQYATAKNVITKLYQQSPENREVRYNFAMFSYRSGEPEKAKTILTQLVKDYNNDDDAWFLLADVEYALKNIAQAEDILYKKISGSNNHKIALQKLAQIHFEQKHYDKSLSDISSILSSNRLNINALILKAKNLIALNNKKEAKHQLDILMGLVNENPRQLLTLSQLQTAIQDNTSAEYSLQLAYKLAPKALPVIIDRVKNKLRLKKIKEAKKIIATAEKNGYKNNNYLLILKGDIALAEKHSVQSFNYFKQVLKQDDTNVIALIKLSQVGQMGNLPDRFTKVVTALVNKYPDRPFLRNTLADHLLNFKHYAGAKFQYQQLLTRNLPLAKRAIALNNLANIHIHDKEYDTAIELAKQALKIAGNKPFIVDTLGWALVKSDQYDAGLSYLRQAYSMSSVSPDIQYHIAYALVKLARIDEAKTMLNNLVSQPNNFDEYPLAKSLLAEIN